MINRQNQLIAHPYHKTGWKQDMFTMVTNNVCVNNYVKSNTVYHAQLLACISNPLYIVSIIYANGRRKSSPTGETKPLITHTGTVAYYRCWDHRKDYNYGSVGARQLTMTIL